MAAHRTSSDSSGDGTLGIIAGRGLLPVQLARACQRNGRDCFIIGLEGEADSAIEDFAHEWATLGQFAHIGDRLLAAGCAELVVIGAIKRPDLGAVSFDEGGLWFLDWVSKQTLAADAAGNRGDDALLRGVVAYFEHRQLPVIAPEAVLASLLAPEGAQTNHAHNAHFDDITRARLVAQEIGRLDIGQSVIVCRGLVLGVEGPEGTDALLQRVGQLPEGLRGTPLQRAGVLAKFPKPQQERRIDLPTLGVPTIEGAAAANLAGIVYEAGGALFDDAEAMAARAEELGLFLVGMAAL